MGTRVQGLGQSFEPKMWDFRVRGLAFGFWGSTQMTSHAVEPHFVLPKL